MVPGRGQIPCKSNLPESSALLRPDCHVPPDPHPGGDALNPRGAGAGRRCRRGRRLRSAGLFIGPPGPPSACPRQQCPAGGGHTAGMGCIHGMGRQHPWQRRWQSRGWVSRRQCPGEQPALSPVHHRVGGSCGRGPPGRTSLARGALLLLVLQQVGRPVALLAQGVGVAQCRVLLCVAHAPQGGVAATGGGRL